MSKLYSHEGLVLLEPLISYRGRLSHCESVRFRMVPLREIGGAYYGVTVEPFDLMCTYAIQFGANCA